MRSVGIPVHGLDLAGHFTWIAKIPTCMVPSLLLIHHIHILQTSSMLIAAGAWPTQIVVKPCVKRGSLVQRMPVNMNPAAQADVGLLHTRKFLYFQSGLWNGNSLLRTRTHIQEAFRMQSMSTPHTRCNSAPACAPLASHTVQCRLGKAPHRVTLSYRAASRPVQRPTPLPGQSTLPCSSFGAHRQHLRSSWVAAAGKDDSIDFADRAIAGLVYIVPLLDSMRYGMVLHADIQPMCCVLASAIHLDHCTAGTFIFRQFPWVLQLLSPLLPVLKIYAGFPLGR